MSLRLRDGDRVCIVGGGPGGSFSALHLLRLAQEHGLGLEVLIFEPRNFSKAGRGSCKGCAGILSAGLVRNMSALGLSLPKEVVQAELRAYLVRVYDHVATIEQPDHQKRIVSVYRGGGPRLHQGEALASFDGYLLSQALARGAKLVPSKARLVEWDDSPVVQTALESFPADLLVLATGVNSQAPLSPAFGYRSPQTTTMMQDEVLRPDNWPDYEVAGFFRQPPGLAFGAVVPKGRYLGVSLLWRNSPSWAKVSDRARGYFYESQAQTLGQFFSTHPESLCGCTPRIVVRPAKTYFGNRWVAVGDAVVSRLYKDGIGSAFLTARAAMRTAVELGITRRDFERSYAPFCRGIATDNVYGRIMFGLSLRAMGNPLLARACIECVRAEASQPVARRVFSRVLWGMLTGDESYRDLFWLLFKPEAIVSLGRELLRAAI